MGHNGAGKSTTMNVLTGMLSPSDGSAQINGFNIGNEMNMVGFFSMNLTDSTESWVWLRQQSLHLWNQALSQNGSKFTFTKWLEIKNEWKKFLFCEQWLVFTIKWTH